MILKSQVEWALHCCAILAGLPEGRYLSTKALAELHVPGARRRRCGNARRGWRDGRRLLPPARGVRLAAARRPLDRFHTRSRRSELPGCRLPAWSFSNGSEDISVRISPRLTACSAVAIHRAALAGAGLAVLSHIIAVPDIAAGRLIPVMAETVRRFCRACGQAV